MSEGVMNRWSFDDEQIGRLRDTGRSIEPETVIEYRYQQTTEEWYRYAGHRVEELNAVLEE